MKTKHVCTWECNTGDHVTSSAFPSYADGPTWEVRIRVVWTAQDKGGRTRYGVGFVEEVLDTDPSLGQLIHERPGPRKGAWMILRPTGPLHTDVDFRPARKGEVVEMSTTNFNGGHTGTAIAVLYGFHRWVIFATYGTPFGGGHTADTQKIILFDGGSKCLAEWAKAHRWDI